MANLKLTGPIATTGLFVIGELLKNNSIKLKKKILTQEILNYLAPFKLESAVAKS